MSKHASSAEHATALAGLAAEGERILIRLSRLASLDVPCPPKCAAALVGRFPDPPWVIGLDRLDRKGEEAMYRAASQAEPSLEPWIVLLSAAAIFHERALDALLAISVEGATEAGAVEDGAVERSRSCRDAVMRLFCLLVRSHLLAATTPRALVLQVHAYAYAVNRGWRGGGGRSGHSSGGVGVVVGGGSGDGGSSIRSVGGIGGGEPSPSPQSASDTPPRLHPSYSLLVAFIAAYTAPVPSLQRDCHALSAVVCEALDADVIPTFTIVAAPMCVVQMRTGGVLAPPQQRQRRQQRLGDLQPNQRHGHGRMEQQGQPGRPQMGGARMEAVLEGLSRLERHLEWVVWGFLCCPARAVESVARSNALKAALTHMLVQPLARARWVMVHPLMSHHAAPVMHAFGKSLERASKGRVNEAGRLPQGVDARGYKRQLRGLVDEARVAAVGGVAAAHHAERRVYVAQECAALAARLDGEVAAAAHGGWWRTEASVPIAVPHLVQVMLLKAALATALAEVRWLLHHTVAEAGTNGGTDSGVVGSLSKLTDVVTAPAVASLVGGGTALRHAVNDISQLLVTTSGVVTGEVNGTVDAVGFPAGFCSSELGPLLRTFPGRAAALVEASVIAGMGGHIAAVIAKLISPPAAAVTATMGGFDDCCGRAEHGPSPGPSGDVDKSGIDGQKEEELRECAAATAAAEWSVDVVIVAAASNVAMAVNAVNDCDRVALRVARHRLAALGAAADARASALPQTELPDALRCRLVGKVRVAIASAAQDEGAFSHITLAAHVEAMQAAGIWGAPSIARSVVEAVR